MLAIALPLVLALAAPAPALAANALRAADVALSRASERRDPDAFAALLEPDAVFASRGGLAEGRAAIVESWAAFFRAGGPRLTWAPVDAELAASGDLGFTIGRFRLERRPPDGPPETTEGEYLTVWRRGADGAFRVAFDANLQRGAPPAGARTTPVRRLASSSGDLEAELSRFEVRPGDPPVTGVFLAVRRRRGGTTEAVVETAFPFRRPAG